MHQYKTLGLPTRVLESIRTNQAPIWIYQLSRRTQFPARGPVNTHRFSSQIGDSSGRRNAHIKKKSPFDSSALLCTSKDVKDDVHSWGRRHYRIKCVLQWRKQKAILTSWSDFSNLRARINVCVRAYVFTSSKLTSLSLSEAYHIKLFHILTNEIKDSKRLNCLVYFALNSDKIHSEAIPEI